VFTKNTMTNTLATTSNKAGGVADDDTRENHHPYQDLISLRSIQVNENRRVAFATVGSVSADNAILFFYAAGGSRRTLLPLHSFAVDNNLCLVCVNRPGKAGTSKASSSGRAAPHHVETVVRDAVAVLDALRIARVRGILFQCAGAPFALAFASRRPDRCSGNLMGIGTWVLPADCPRQKRLYRVGTHLPTAVISAVVAGSMMSMMSYFQWRLSPKTFGAHFRNRVLASDTERRAFDEIYPDTDDNKKEEFCRRTMWMLQEKGGEAMDLQVLLSSSAVIGLDYDRVPAGAQFFHAEGDRMTPIEAVEWMVHNKLPSATLVTIPDASHEGTLFLLHKEIQNGLKELVKVGT